MSCKYKKKCQDAPKTKKNNEMQVVHLSMVVMPLWMEVVV